MANAAMCSNNEFKRTSLLKIAVYPSHLHSDVMRSVRYKKLLHVNIVSWLSGESAG